MNAEPRDFTAPRTAATLGFVTGLGERDTHGVTMSDGRPNPHPSAGTTYDTITGSEIARLVREPQDGVPKERARWFIPSTYHADEARTHEAQAGLGEFWWLTLDVDRNNLPMVDVRDALTEATGGATMLIYSSRSATAENRKWRALLPLAAPLSGADFPDTQHAFFDLVEKASAGILIPDRALAKVGQLVYLPNRGQFYEWEIVKGAAQ